MPLFEVAVIEMPTPKELEDGAIELLVLGPTAVVAKDQQSAAVAVALKSDIKFDVAKCQVLVRPFA